MYVYPLRTARSTDVASGLVRTGGVHASTRPLLAATVIGAHTATRTTPALS